MTPLIVSRNNQPGALFEPVAAGSLPHEELWIDGVYTPMLPACEIRRWMRHDRAKHD